MTKTAMTAEHLHPQLAVLSQAMREHMRTTQTPPAYAHVWAAPYAGRVWGNLTAYQHGGKLDIPGRRQADGELHFIQGTTLGLGGLLVLVILTSWDQIHDPLATYGLSAMTRIWPVPASFYAWPFGKMLGDVEAARMAQIVGQVILQP